MHSWFNLCRLPFRRYEYVGVRHRKTDTLYLSDHIEFSSDTIPPIVKLKLDFTLLFFQMLSIVFRRSKKCLSPTSSEQSGFQKTQSKPLISKTLLIVSHTPKFRSQWFSTLHQESKTEERGAYISIKNSIFVHNLYIPWYACFDDYIAYMPGTSSISFGSGSSLCSTCKNCSDMNALQLPFSYPQNAQHFAYCPYWFTYSPVFYAYVGYEALKPYIPIRCRLRSIQCMCDRNMT